MICPRLVFARKNRRAHACRRALRRRPKGTRSNPERWPNEPCAEERKAQARAQERLALLTQSRMPSQKIPLVKYRLEMAPKPLRRRNWRHVPLIVFTAWYIVVPFLVDESPRGTNARFRSTNAPSSDTDAQAPLCQLSKQTKHLVPYTKRKIWIRGCLCPTSRHFCCCGAQA